MTLASVRSESDQTALSVQLTTDARLVQQLISDAVALTKNKSTKLFRDDKRRRLATTRRKRVLALQPYGTLFTQTIVLGHAIHVASLFRFAFAFVRQTVRCGNQQQTEMKNECARLGELQSEPRNAFIVLQLKRERRLRFCRLRSFVQRSYRPADCLLV